MSLDQQKPTLQLAISKIMWNLRSLFQSKLKCSPFEIHFNRKPNTIWKQLASRKSSGGFLDKGKSIFSRERTLDWNADDRIEDGYKDSLVPKKNQSLVEKGYDSDYPPASKPSSSRLPLQGPFKGKILRKTGRSINGNPFYKQLGQKNYKCIKIYGRFQKSKSSTNRSFRENISFPSFINPDFQVGSRKTSKQKLKHTHKIGPKTRRQIELATSDNNTMTRVTNQQVKSYKFRQTLNKASTSNT